MMPRGDGTRDGTGRDGQGRPGRDGQGRVGRPGRETMVPIGSGLSRCLWKTCHLHGDDPASPCIRLFLARPTQLALGWSVQKMQSICSQLTAWTPRIYLPHCRYLQVWKIYSSCPAVLFGGPYVVQVVQPGDPCEDPGPFCWDKKAVG